MTEIKDATIEDVPQCSYNPETGELMLESGGIFRMEFKADIDDKLWHQAVEFMRNAAKAAGCTVICIAGEARMPVCVSHDEEYAERVNRQFFNDAQKTGPVNDSV